MRRTLLLGGFTLVGILVAGIAFLFIKLTIFSGYLDNPNRGDSDFLILVSFKIIPLSLFVGSCFTGYLSQPYGHKKLLKNLFLAPGLYASLLPVIYDLLLLTMNPGPVDSVSLILNVLFTLLICLLWILSSVFGLFLGMKIRA